MSMARVRRSLLSSSPPLTNQPCPRLMGSVEIDDDEEEGDSQIEGIVSSNSSNDGVPATPNKNPPKNSPTLGAHQDNAMTKSEPGPPRSSISRETQCFVDPDASTLH